MESSDRQQRILSLLLAQRGYITSEEIAERLGVSVRTVYRDIAAINQKSLIIHNTPSKGIRLDYKAYLETAALFQDEERSGGLSVRDRRRTMLLLLLFAAPAGYSIGRLSEIFFVAQSSIQQDLKRVAEEVQRYELRLEPTHAGTRLVGPEQAIRNALMEQAGPLLAAFGSPADANPAAALSGLDVLREHGLLAPEDFVVVERVIHSVETQFGFRIENPEYQDLLTYLLIVVERVRYAQTRDHSGPAPLEAAAPTGRTSLAGVPGALVDEIAHRLGLAVPAAEAGPLRAFLFRSWNTEDAAIAEAHVAAAPVVAERIIELVSSDLGVPVGRDPTLREKLLAHLEPMLVRTEHGMQVQNPVLAEIRSQFPEVYDAVGRALVVCESETGIRHISESEAAYLVLYLQSAVDSQRNLQRLRVIVVCSTGRSTAYFLRGRLEERFPQWDIVGVLGTRELEERMGGGGFPDVDLFVSTVAIPNGSVPAAVISPLVGDRDVEVILQALEPRTEGTPR